MVYSVHETFVYRTVHNMVHQMGWARMARKNGSKATAVTRKAAQMTPAVRRVAAYLRVSTDDQRESGLGLDDQRMRCQAMATVKGWPAPTLYVDEGLSGTKEAKDRPALAQLLADVRVGQVDAVIVLDLSRLARRTRLVLDLVEEMTHCGATLVSCKESLDTTTPQGQFVLTIFAALAQLERDLIAQRTKGALIQLAQRGRGAGRVPFGYLLDATSTKDDGGPGVVVDPERAEVVRRIFAWRRRGLSLRAIAEKLRQEGYLPPRGAIWHHTAVVSILANRDAYRGGTRGTSQEVRWPRILGHTDAAA